MEFPALGYVVTVTVELPVLLVGLSRRHSVRDRILAGFALTAFTYPIVVCVLPPLVWGSWGRLWSLLVAETFAPVAECLLFRAAHGPAPSQWIAVRDNAVIVIANLLSFGAGQIVYAWLGSS